MPIRPFKLMVARLEAKRAVRKTKKIGNAHIFEALVTRPRHSVAWWMTFCVFRWPVAPLMSHLVDTGRLTKQDVEAAQEALRKAERED